MDRLADLHRTVSASARGVGFARYVQALCRTGGDVMAAAELASQWTDTPSVALALKAAVTAGTTTATAWGAPLWQYQTLATEFAELLRPMLVTSKLTGMRRVPFNTRILRELQGSTVGWVGEGQAKPVSELQFDAITLGLSKIAGIAVLTQELARASGNAAETLILDDLKRQIAQFLDAQFLSPGVIATANNPGSITSGLTPIISAGSTVANIITDINSLVAELLTAGGTLTSPYLIMRASTALALAGKRDSAGGAAFGSITVNGGTLLGLPVLISNAVPGSVSGGSIVILVDADGILFAEDQTVRIDVSTEASLQLDSAPSNSAASQISLWANDMIGLKAEKYANWKRRRDTGFVAYLDFVSY